jgi:uncharacterized membrane protein
MPLADVHLEFLGDSPWWVAIGATAGVALLVYAFMQWRYQRLPPPPSAGPVRSPTSAPVDLIKPASSARTVIAAVVGALVLLITFALAYAARSTDAHPLAVDTPRTAATFAWLALALGMTVVLFYRGVYAALRPWQRASLVTLRLAGMAALLLLLFRPVLAVVNRAEATKPTLAVVVDASASMGYTDAANQPTRFRQAAIAVEQLLAPRLADAYRLRVFAYDGGTAAPLAAPAALEAITPTGDVTDLGAAVAGALSSPAAGDSASPAAAVLLSDGIHNGPASIEAELKSFTAAVPVHTVRVGSSDLEPSAVPDIAVVSIDGPATAVVNNVVTLTAAIRSTALSDRTVRVSLFEKPPTGAVSAAAKPLDEQRLVLHSGALPQTVQLKFTPDKVGRATVRVQVPVDPAERSDANNQQDASILVTDPKLTVLYVEGRVRPEVGPLRRALEQDPNLAAMSLVQTTAGRFELGGVRPGDDLKGLPTTLAQWKRFKVIVLGDLDASFLSPQQQKDLEQAVRDGAGLVMLGGRNSFAPGGWGKTTLAALLPVSLDPVTPDQLNAPFVPRLTAVGALHPVFRTIAPYFLPADGAATQPAGAATLPELSGCVALGAAKAGASVLAVHPTEKVRGEPAIVLAVQQYGRGRTAAFAADTTWRWSLFLRAMQKESPYFRFWGQLVRWLASQEDLEKKTGASVTAMLAKERFEGGDTVPLRAAVTDPQGQATNFAKAWADVTGPDGKTDRVAMGVRGDTGDGGGGGSGGGGMGMYEASHKPLMAGTYKVTFGATKDGADLGKDETTFTVLAAAGERDQLAAQPRTLETISRATGGTGVDLPAADALVDRLLAAAPRPPAAAATAVPLYHPRGLFLAFVACLTTEWLLRRRWQLQ